MNVQRSQVGLAALGRRDQSVARSQVAVAEVGKVMAVDRRLMAAEVTQSHWREVEPKEEEVRVQQRRRLSPLHHRSVAQLPRPYWRGRP